MTRSIAAVACTLALLLAAPLGKRSPGRLQSQEMHRPRRAVELDLQGQPEMLLRLAAAQGNLHQPPLLLRRRPRRAGQREFVETPAGGGRGSDALPLHRACQLLDRLRGARPIRVHLMKPPEDGERRPVLADIAQDLR